MNRRGGFNRYVVAFCGVWGRRADGLVGRWIRSRRRRRSSVLVLRLVGKVENSQRRGVGRPVRLYDGKTEGRDLDTGM